MTTDTADFEGVSADGGIAGYEPDFVDVDGTRTRYYELGADNDETLVLLHGGNWSGLSSANIWAPSFEHLRDSFRVLAFDRVGCGLTDNPETVEEYRYETEIEHARGFLDAMDVDTCHVAGSSRGAGLAARLAVGEPDRFDTLTIINSATLGPRAGDERHRLERVFGAVEEAYEPTDPEYTRAKYRQYAHRTDYLDDEFCRTNAYLRSRPKAERTAEVLEEEGRQAFWEETMREQMDETHRRIKDGRLTMPTLYLFGRNDLTVPVEMAMAAFDMIGQENSDVRMKVVNECGHIIYRERPAEFADSVIDFVEQWRDR